MNCYDECRLKNKKCRVKECRLWINYPKDLNCTEIAVQKNDKLVFREIGNRLKLTPSRVKQIETAALKKIKYSIKHNFQYFISGLFVVLPTIYTSKTFNKLRRTRIMSKKQKPLLQEGTVRRMMKLANMEALGNGFISEKYTPLEEDEAYTAKKEKPGEDKRKGAEKRGAEGTLAKTKGHGKVDYVDENLTEEDDIKEGFEDELDATEDELGAEDSFADEEGAEIDDLEAEEAGEVTITDEEAQDIIDLADKLKGAVGDEPADDVEIEAEEEIDLEEPATRSYEENLDEESIDEDALYEAALKGLQIDILNDKKEQQEAKLQEAKRRVYKRVVKRLLKRNKK